MTISANKCGGNCNTTNNPYARVFVPKKVKNMNPKVFNLISGRNETRFMVLVSVTVDLMKVYVIPNKKWKYDECPCACKELDDWRFYERDYMWNLSTCDCDCNKACKIDEYLDTKSRLCKKTINQ